MSRTAHEREEIEKEAQERVDRFFASDEEGNFLRRITSIADYSFRIAIPPVKVPLEGPRSDKIINTLYDRVVQINRSAGFHFPQHLEAVRLNNVDNQGIGLKYGDDEYDFTLVLSEGQISLLRPGSSLLSFVQWYSRFMPSARQLVETAFQTMMEDAGVEVVATTATHGFRFRLYELHREGDSGSEEVKNWQVLERMITHYPGEDGRVVAVGEIAGGRNAQHVEGEGTHVGRIDFDLCRWVLGTRDQRVQCWYGVEAPANKLWSTLWISCRLQGQSYKSPHGGSRTDFDASRFLADYEFPLFDFLKRRVISGVTIQVAG